MESLLRKQTINNEGFFKPELRHSDHDLLNADLPTFLVERASSKIVIDLNLDSLNPNSTVGSSLTSVIEIPEKNLMNMVHDITFGHIADSTDVKLSSKFGIVGDGYDHLSPDMIVETTSGSYIVVEFTTFRGSERGCLNAAKDKFAKYQIACENRSRTVPVSLYVISVHRDGLWTNMTMSQEEVNELVFRYRMALSIHEESRKICPELTDDDSDLSKAERELLGTLSFIDLDWNKTEKIFPMFKKAVFDNFHTSPPDENYMSHIISKELERSQSDLLKSSFFQEGLTAEDRRFLNRSECDIKINEFLKAFDREEELRDPFDSKSTIQIPPWVFTDAEEGKSLTILKILKVEGEHPMARFWRHVVSSAQLEEIDRMYDDPEAELQYALSGDIPRAEQKNKYHRVKLNLSSEEDEYLATLGISGKKMKDLASVKESRARSKKAFSIQHDISRLENFLYGDSSKIFEANDDLFCPLAEDFELRMMAQAIHQPTMTKDQGPNEVLKNHLRLLHTPFGSWCQMVSLIGAELSASVKQHVKPGQFIIKRLLNSPLIMAVRPTSSKSHIFVSFGLIKAYHAMDIETGNVFKSYIDAGDLFITDFVSYKLSKLTNLCKCSSLMECSSNFWIEAFNYAIWDSAKLLAADRSPGVKEASFMIKLSLLTLLEDKAVTEELQTIQRYIMMEGFVSQPELPKPHKMLNKVPGVLRSELQVFLFWRVIKSMKRISESPFLLSKRNGQISWSGLFNPLSGNDVRSLQAVISSCYNGYFKNKEEETEPSSLSKMYKKIIELEHLCPEDDKYLGMSDPEDPKMHEFSRSYLKQSVLHGKDLLKRMYGQNFMEQIDRQITREVASLSLERLATLKATSNFNESWYEYKDVKDKNYTREKVLVRMSEIAKDGKTLAIHAFNDCMNAVESRGCMHICLFKKQQHGGLREIYVLGAEERIVQSLIETIARSIGRFFPSDTLCNPNNKMKIPESHGLRARKHCKGPVWTCATSDDARKWNQGHFVTKFALMLCEFTHPKWWPIIIRGCSMFTNKYMMMNLQYLRILDSHMELKVEDQFVQDLFKAYHGEVPQTWMDPGKTFIKTKTGMMQGILHFTSSLLHTLHQEFVRSLTFRIFNMKVHPEMSYSMVCDMMQGSDDSSMLLSFPAKDEPTIMRCKMAAAICFRMKKNLGVYLAIYPSEKSTSNTDFVMEYNSEFFFHSQHVRPTIRWIAASCSLPEVETLVARQEEASNLMTAVTEGGGSFSLAYSIQQAQCTLHYMLMGMGVSSLFSEFKKAIAKWKDPGLGFFLLDNPYCAGLGGFRFNLYKAITRTSLKRLYAYFMKKVRSVSEDEQLEACSVSPGGAIILSSSLKWGSRQKYLKLRSRLNIPDNWIDLINENPSVLYRAPRTSEEIMLRIAEKVHSPGVVSSLSTGNAVAKVMASSVYFLSASIFQDSNKQEFSIMESSKYSLLQKMMAYDGFENNLELTMEDILFLFPNIDDLQQLDCIVYDRCQIQVAQRVSHKENTQTKITVFEGHQNLKTPAEYMVSDKWFGTMKSKIGSSGFENEWSKLKTIITWLTDTPAATLEKSPLSNHVQIRNFFSRMESKPRTVRVTGAPVKKRSGSSKISLVIRDNFTKIGFLRDFEDISSATRAFSVEVLKHFLFCTLQGPYSVQTKFDLCYKILSESEVIGIRESDGKTRTNQLAVFQNFVNGDPDIIHQIESIGAGTIGGFIIPQKSKEVSGKVFYYGRGVWRGVMDGSQIQIEIDNKQGLPPQIVEISFDGRIGIWEVCRSIRSWCEDVGVKNDVDMSKRSRSGARFWLYDFKAFTQDKPFGCPVYVTSSRMTDFRSVSNEDVKFKIRKCTMNLFLKNGGRDIHILTYTAHDGDLSSSIFRSPDDSVCRLKKHFSKEPSSSWASCQSLPFAFVHKVLELCSGVLVRDHIDNERLSKIVQLCTENSLRTKVGTIYSALPNFSEGRSIIDVDSIVDLMIEDMAKEDFNDAVKMMETEEPASYESESFDISDIDLFGPAHYKEVSELTTISHPLMDDFVNVLILKCGRKDIRRCLETGRCMTRNKVYMRDLFSSIGRNPNDVQADDYNESESDPDDDLIG
uniref:RNA-directed RNA polymerase L n=1 Tax=Punta toro phlebovirus TaxID=11587 RepID=A0A0F6ZNG5_PTPV|nr:L protein [Punta Toro virus]